jgi:hypothetical protein
LFYPHIIEFWHFSDFSTSMVLHDAIFNAIDWISI